MSDQCSIAIRPAGRTAFIEVEGYLNASATSPEIVAQRAIDNGARFVVLDLRRASEMDKEGLRWLADMRDILDNRRVGLRVVVTESSKIRRILAFMQYDKFLSLVSSGLQAWKFRKRRLRLRRCRANH